MGLWDSLKETILSTLNFFYSWTGDYGVSIVLLTVAMRLLIMPLTLKSTKSMHEMQRIQPKVKELQAKYKKDPEKLQAETMKFYQENKVNPFGGCLPLLLQMPIFIALFQVLGGNEKNPGLFAKMIEAMPAEQAAKAVRFWYILPDLTASPQAVFSADGLVAALPYIVFVALFAISVYLPQKMMTSDPQQARVGLYMSLMMLYFGWISPGGVLLYWVVSSLWQIVQQWATIRRLERQEGAVAE